MSRVFLDTNILAYACDQDQPDKRLAAQELLRILDGHEVCISTQVVQEFYVTATRKLGVDPLKAKEIISTFRYMEIALVDIDDIFHAIDGNVLWQVSFWDALIIVAARKLNCTRIFSEDLNHRQVFDSVEIFNPFTEKPQLG